MSDELVYRGYSIRAQPYRLHSGDWRLEGYLISRGTPHKHEIKFFFDGAADSRHAAVERIFAEGRRLVDFRSPEATPQRSEDRPGADP